MARDTRGRRARTVAGVVGALALMAPPTASATTYKATAADLITARYGNGTDWAYKAPRVFVQGQSINRDSYECAATPANARAQTMNNWVLVPDDLGSSDLSFTSTGNLSPIGSAGPTVTITTWNWSDTTAHVRVVHSCTNSIDAFPTTWSYGNYYRRWLTSLAAGKPDFKCLVSNAFYWNTEACATAGVPAEGRGARAAASAPLAPLVPVASPGGNVYALENGINRLAMTFRHPSASRRPPVFYYSTRPASAGCEARRMHVPVNRGFGYLHLVLRCSGLRTGATAKLTLRPAIRRTFPLREGRGVGRIRLDKPPGTVKPLVFVSTRSAAVPCDIRSRQVRMARRTVDLRIDGRCGRVPRGARGELAVGGLIAEKGPEDRPGG